MAFAEALQQLTTIVGYTTWRDKTRITGGLKFNDEIARGIEDSPIFLPLFSADYFHSEPCKKELEYAQQEGKYIFAVVIDDAAPPELDLIHQVRLKCDDKNLVPAAALARTVKELHQVIGDPATVEIRFPEGSDPEWPDDDLQQSLMNTRWSWCDNHEFIGENWIEFRPANRVTRSWARHTDGDWEVLKNGLLRFGPHIVDVDIENGVLRGASGKPGIPNPERSGRFLNHVTNSGKLD